jgi:hypothetical protein
MPNRNRHSKPEVEAAVRYAEQLGWRVVAGSGHNWCRLYCPLESREGCQVGVYSTPKNPGNHARQIRNAVDRCPHCERCGPEEEGADAEG